MSEDKTAKKHAIGYSLRRARETHGYTQGALASSLGVSQPTISNWEHGNKVAGMDDVVNMAEVYGAPVSDLVPTQDDINRALRLIRGKDK